MDGMSEVRARVAEIQTQLLAFQTPTTANAEWATAAAASGLGLASRAVGSSAAPPAGTVAAPQARPNPDASPLGAAIVAQAQQYLGVPYLWGGTDPSTGLDCSGFTQLVYRSQGIELPRVSSQQATAGTAVASLTEARPGDLLFFDYSPSRPGIDHVGIYLGDGQMIAAPQPGEVVKIQSVGEPTVIRRVLPQEPA
jgi:cell wall-associated NlpC family hydrolase